MASECKHLNIAALAFAWKRFMISGEPGKASYLGPRPDSWLSIWNVYFQSGRDVFNLRGDAYEGVLSFYRQNSLLGHYMWDISKDLELSRTHILLKFVKLNGFPRLAFRDIELRCLHAQREEPLIDAVPLTCRSWHVLADSERL